MPLHDVLNSVELAVNVAQGANQHGCEGRKGWKGWKGRKGRKDGRESRQAFQPPPPFQPYAVPPAPALVAAGTSRSCLSQMKSFLL